MFFLVFETSIGKAFIGIFVGKVIELGLQCPTIYCIIIIIITIIIIIIIVIIHLFFLLFPFYHTPPLSPPTPGLQFWYILAQFGHALPSHWHGG